jgi:hypothetical protein
MAEDDLVLLHTESAPTPGAIPSAVVDICRRMARSSRTGTPSSRSRVADGTDLFYRGAPGAQASLTDASPVVGPAPGRAPGLLLWVTGQVLLPAQKRGAAATGGLQP